jgi:hypothetical protein
MCVRNECPGGTYLSMETGHCEMCNPTCNTCSDKDTCTSCFTDFRTGADMFSTGDGKCVSECPLFTEENLTTHECDSDGIPGGLFYTSLSVLVASFAACLGLVGYSKTKAGGGDEPLGIFTASATQFAFLNSSLLTIVLWPSTYSILFVGLGGSLIG